MSHPEQAAGFLRPRHARDFRNFALYFPVLLLVSACHKPTAPPPVNESSTSPASPALTESTDDDDTAPPDFGITIEADDPDRWLRVEKTREGTSGGWATGSFDPKRNKLAIRTHSVEQFAIDLSRVSIEWERLVVIGINGRNAELRKRDYSVLHFARNRNGQWVVIEP